jgi:hypothetical protein
MELTQAMTEELFQVMRSSLPKEAPGFLDDMILHEVQTLLAPVIERWLTDYAFTINEAETFISGFEDDEAQQPFVNTWLSNARALLASGPGPAPEPQPEQKPN